MQVALIDVGIGNIDSVSRALGHLAVPHERVASPAGLAGATHVVLPGVGAYRAGMDALRRSDLVEPLRKLATQRTGRIFGICLGMQLLGRFSEEGDCEGLNLLSFDVTRLVANSNVGLKVPHVGFASVGGYDQRGLFENLGSASDFYFTHSFAARGVPGQVNIGWVAHTEPVVAAFDAGHVCGAQFHPEKSQSNGLRLLRNFFRN